jgi:Super-infection exclusion protein B
MAPNTESQRLADNRTGGGLQSFPIGRTCRLASAARFLDDPACRVWPFSLRMSRLASMGSTTLKMFPVHQWLMVWINSKRRSEEVREYIPHMTERERAIIAYLLARNQRTFTVDQDGGHAATLISMGIVDCALRPGQIFRQDDMPVVVPSYIWKVLEEHKDQFPYKPRSDGWPEPHPWRISWMAQ